MNDTVTIRRKDWKELNASKWISVDDRLPETEGMYLCYFSDDTIETFEYVVSDTKLWGIHQDIVTHWQKLPAPPEDV